MYRLLTSSARSFAADERGNVAVMFALMSTVILLVAGIAIDYARTVNMSSRIGAAADAATLAAGRAMLDGKLNDAEVRQLANSFLRHNAEAGGAMSGKYSQPTISLDRDLGSVRVDVGVTVPTTLTRITGHKEMNAPVATAAVFEQKDVEVAMALDVTGSMTESAGGQRKIDGLKFAFRRFVEKLIPEHKADGRKVRVAVAPYSSGVNMGGFAKGASGNRSRDNCVIERTGRAAASDSAVGAGSYFKVHEDQPKDTDNTEGRQEYTCPNATIIPLTDDRTLLTTTVDRYRASGSTGGHLGVQWAWNLVSENWGSFWGPDSRPDPYSRTKGGKDAELVKAVILMTDGVFNTSFFNGGSSQQATALCGAMRHKNVLVFSIAFGNPPTQAKRTLENCATPGAEYYADASNTAELDAALSRFAGTLTKLRLSQ